MREREGEKKGERERERDRSAFREGEQRDRDRDRLSETETENGALTDKKIQRVNDCNCVIKGSRRDDSVFLGVYASLHQDCFMDLFYLNSSF